MKKIISILLILCMMLSLPLTAFAASEMGDLESYGVKLIQYYLHHQEAADDVIWDLVEQMKVLDPEQGLAWEKIMADWSWINSEMPINVDGLPDGLPQDNSLCIVVMGFGLNENGSMKPELEDRLVVALVSALKYPNAYVLVTGGQTGQVDGVTEAGQMAAWLQKKGLAKDRIIQERQSLSTTANAVNTYKLLTRSYPQVDSIAVITSDYHITQSCAMFAAMSNYQSGYKGGKSLELVGNAVCDTGTQWDSLAQQAWGMSLIIGLPYEDNTKAPKLYHVDRPEIQLTEATEPAEETKTVPGWPPIKFSSRTESETAEPESKTGTLLIAGAAAAAVLVFWVLTPKKPRKKNRRRRPKMNWEDNE